MAAVAAALLVLASANSRSSSSCEADSAAPSAAAGTASSDGPRCDTADVMTATAVTPDETASATAPAPGGTDNANHVAAGGADADDVVAVQVMAAPAGSIPTNPGPATSAPTDPNPAPANAGSAPASATPAPAPAPAPASATPAPAPSNASPAPVNAAPAPANPTPAPVSPRPAAPAPANPGSTRPAAPAPASPNPTPGNYDDITTFGVFHGTSSHTHVDSLAGGRKPITTEALVSYNDLRSFLGLGAADLDSIGRWAFANRLTNNGEAYQQELSGVGLYYAMQGAKVGWIRDDAYNPQILADIQRAARQGGTAAVMTMVEDFGHPGYADHLTRSGLVGVFVNTLEMEPHYGGWMHGRVHGSLPFSNGSGASVATAHDLNHLTVLSHDQTQPFMNDTFDWPQWPALDVPNRGVINYFQSMVVLGDPHGSPLP